MNLRITIFLTLMYSFNLQAKSQLNGDIEINNCKDLNNLKKVNEINGNLIISLDNPKCNEIKIKKLKKVKDLMINIETNTHSTFKINFPRLKTVQDLWINSLTETQYSLNFKKITSIQGIHLQNFKTKDISFPKLNKLDRIDIIDLKSEALIFKNITSVQNIKFRYGKINNITIPKLEKIIFLEIYNVKNLTSISLPKLNTIQHLAISDNKQLFKLYFPNLKKVNIFSLTFPNINILSPKKDHIEINVNNLRQITEGLLINSPRCLNLKMNNLRHSSGLFLLMNSLQTIQNNCENISFPELKEHKGDLAIRRFNQNIEFPKLEMINNIEIENTIFNESNPDQHYGDGNLKLEFPKLVNIKGSLFINYSNYSSIHFPKLKLLKDELLIQYSTNLKSLKLGAIKTPNEVHKIINSQTSYENKKKKKYKELEVKVKNNNEKIKKIEQSNNNE